MPKRTNQDNSTIDHTILFEQAPEINNERKYIANVLQKLETLNIKEIFIEELKDLEHFTSLESYILYIAIFINDEDKIKLILKEYNIDLNYNIINEDLSIKTHLMYAAIFGRKSIVELLIHYGADQNITDEQDETAACYAIEYEYFDIARLLLSRDDMNQYSKNVLLLSIAKHQNLSEKFDFNYLPIFNICLEAGADPKFIGLNGKTVLSYCEEFEQRELGDLISSFANISSEHNDMFKIFAADQKPIFDFGITPSHVLGNIEEN